MIEFHRRFVLRKLYRFNSRDGAIDSIISFRVFPYGNSVSIPEMVRLIVRRPEQQTGGFLVSIPEMVRLIASIPVVNLK